MDLTTIEFNRLEDVKQGVVETLNFIGELTEYHGEPISTEYILTVHIARALLARSQPLVAVEYLINQIKGNALLTHHGAQFNLGSQRFDIVVLDQISPKIIIEVKIGVRSLRKISDDINKIMSYLNYIKSNIANSVLGACVFQVHVNSIGRGSYQKTVDRVIKLENNIQKQLSVFAAANPSFEFCWFSFQDNHERIYGDEVIEDIDGTPMLGRAGYAARYHAVLIRRRAIGPSGLFRTRIDGQAGAVV